MTHNPNPPKKRSRKRWSETEALEAAQRLGQGEKVRKALNTPTLSDALRRLGLPVAQNQASAQAPRTQTGKRKSSVKKAKTQGSDPATQESAGDSPGGASVDTPKMVAKKRRGVETGRIFQSLAMTPARARWGKDWLALDFPGARLLSYNELYSILQFRKHEAFRYKKICQKTVRRALETPDHAAGNADVARPFFDGPTRLTLLRVGTKGLDREALPVIFKYFTDTLKKEGVIEDDNPDIIVDIQTLQGLGTERLAMRLDRVKDWVAPPIPNWADWK